MYIVRIVQRFNISVQGAPVWPTRIRLLGRVPTIVLLPAPPLAALKHQIGGPGVGPSENMDNLLGIKAK